MNYYHLKSIIGANKATFQLKTPSESFRIISQQSKEYIEPGFEKVIYETEKPIIILVSAVGATGKTALAHSLSMSTKLPVLDLGKHKPVGDNTLTGVVTSAFKVEDISSILSGLGSGTYGIIIDGVDEGRSKTSAKAFEAFLDDIIKLCSGSKATTFILLGRSQILDDCWPYFSDRGVPTVLVTISPFDLEGAKKYIDAFSFGLSSAHSSLYVEARDFILGKLNSAFKSQETGGINEDFLSFIGYPPVLDSIAALLKTEKNYYKLLEELKKDQGASIEVALLKRIATYILVREREQKVVPNILVPLLDGVPDHIRAPALSGSFAIEEQSARLISYSLGKNILMSQISEPALNKKYEEQLTIWLPDHPFLEGRSFRNAVFEAVALSSLMISGIMEFEQIATEYLSSHKHSYHLIYMLDAMTTDHKLSNGHLNAVLSSAMEFRSTHAAVNLYISGPSYDEYEAAPSAGSVDIDIEICLGAKLEEVKTFSFKTLVMSETCLRIGPRLGAAFITVPCDITLDGGQEIELIAPLEISARCIRIQAKTLIAKSVQMKDAPIEIVFEAQRAESSLESISAGGVSFCLAIEDLSGLYYPTIQYAQKASARPTDINLRQKYFRLKRILLEFRSHSKGSLAKYKHKIEHDRVLKNRLGHVILNRLLYDQILSLSGNFYRLNPEKVNQHLGITWHDLRKGQIPPSLIDYLSEISEPPPE